MAIAAIAAKNNFCFINKKNKNLIRNKNLVV
jgi:hypothetical protein